MYHPFPFLGLVPLSQLSLRAMVPKAHISTSRIRSAFALSVLPSFFLSAEVSSPQLFYDIAEETLERERAGGADHNGIKYVCRLRFRLLGTEMNSTLSEAQGPDHQACHQLSSVDGNLPRTDIAGVMLCNFCITSNPCHFTLSKLLCVVMAVGCCVPFSAVAGV